MGSSPVTAASRMSSKPLVVDRNGRRGDGGAGRSKREVVGECRNAEWFEILHSITGLDGAGDIDHPLWRLAGWYRCDDAVCQRVDCRDGIGVFESNIDSAAVARGPEAVR